MAPMLRRVDAFARLANVAWSALRSAEVIPVLARVLDGEPAEREIDRFLRARRSYGANERAAAVEAIFGVGLWRRRLEWHARSAEPRMLLFALLRDLAGMEEAVAGALCDLGPPWPPRRPEPERLADRWSLPDALEAILLRELGSEAEAFAEAISVPGPICLRANALRTCRASVARRLREEGVETVETQSAPHGLLVTTARPNLLALGSFREGLFEVQDEGSQLVAALCAARAGDVVLDACAGAGGKTLALAADLRNEGRLVACDPDRDRLRRLGERARRAGALVEIADRPPPDLRADVVLVDAPCSGLGILRRGPDARFRIGDLEERALPATGEGRRPEHTIAHLPRLQREILDAVLPLARPGGRIVYATCTIRSEENEEVALAFERDHPELVRESQGAFFRTFPHRDGTDAFFGARWTVSRGSHAAR
ncbi:MAG: RsmB/NOP family class I SAM-dependent RNA methyltransferase [Myxococcales bacterium]